ncbi:DUF4959 domain-containing protein [Dysgonomonas capnocytophagoides]|uniref:DUF4959 domain-containing protein n=1 Tax=Dysgonomonas capnocytophagoides TaxID=45254 RepID=UPI002926E77E|nr:hypothetical protein DCPSUM001_19930 [Dysgonomonas capnocytophagoides]
MRKFYLLFFIIIVTSCTDDDKVSEIAPAKVTDLASSSGPGEVYLSWKNPNDPNLMYVKIEYINSKGEKRYKLISKDKVDKNGASADTIRGFANTELKTFSVFTCSLKGSNQGPVNIEQAPDNPVFETVAKTVNISADYGGIRIDWKNETNSLVYIAVDYHSIADSNKKGTKKITAKANTNGEIFTQLFYEELSVLIGEECIVNMTVQDEEENSSEVKEFKLTPKVMTAISTSSWSFPGYNDSSNSQTIGYSSQEAGGEGASPKGRVIAMIDGDPSTFWHASWKSASDYPHWFILDLGQNYDITNVELVRRLGNNKGQKGQQFFTCSTENAIGADPTSWAWVDQGSYSFNNETNAPQNYRFFTNPKTRYVKVYFGTEYKGSTNYAMVSEIRVYKK